MELLLLAVKILLHPSSLVQDLSSLMIDHSNIRNIRLFSGCEKYAFPYTTGLTIEKTSADNLKQNFKIFCKFFGPHPASGFILIINKWGA